MLNKTEQRNYQIAVAIANKHGYVESQYLLATDPKHEVAPAIGRKKYVAYLCQICGGNGFHYFGLCAGCRGRGLV